MAVHDEMLKRHVPEERRGAWELCDKDQECQDTLGWLLGLGVRSVEEAEAELSGRRDPVSERRLRALTDPERRAWFRGALERARREADAEKGGLEPSVAKALGDMSPTAPQTASREERPRRERTAPALEGLERRLEALERGQGELAKTLDKVLSEVVSLKGLLRDTRETVVEAARSEDDLERACAAVEAACSREATRVVEELGSQVRGLGEAMAERAAGQAAEEGLEPGTEEAPEPDEGQGDGSGDAVERAPAGELRPVAGEAAEGREEAGEEAAGASDDIDGEAEAPADVQGEEAAAEDGPEKGPDEGPDEGAPEEPGAGAASEPEPGPAGEEAGAGPCAQEERRGALFEAGNGRLLTEDEVLQELSGAGIKSVTCFFSSAMLLSQLNAHKIDPNVIPAILSYYDKVVAEQFMNR